MFKPQSQSSATSRLYDNKAAPNHDGATAMLPCWDELLFIVAPKIGLLPHLLWSVLRVFYLFIFFANLGCTTVFLPGVLGT